MSNGTTYAELIAYAQQQLSLFTRSPELEAQLLLAHALGSPQSHVLAWPDRQIDESSYKRFNSDLSIRCSGVPFAYITGRKEFWSMNLLVTPDVLIPRPETECLVETALSYLPADTTSSVLELGTGSGAISIALAKERPAAQITATDISQPALQVAQRNAAEQGTDHIAFLHSDWCSDIPEKCYDLIISNPPYLALDDQHLQHDGLEHEPLSALVSGINGLEAIHSILQQVSPYIGSDSIIMFEHGDLQGMQVCDLLRSHGCRDIKKVNDLAAKHRISIGLFN